MNHSNKKVVLINQSSGFLVVDDLNAYCQKYDEVHLICGHIVPGMRELNPKVKVEHICEYDRSTSIKRLMTWFVGSLQVFFKLLFKYRGWLVVYYTNPPMACFSSLLLPNKFRIVEYDIYPDALKTIGIKEGSFVYNLWGSMKRKLYKKVDRVFTLSEGMKEVLTQYGSADKIKVVPLWSASEDFKPVAKEDNSFIKANGLEGKFVVLYSGNIGYTHSVEVLVSVGESLEVRGSLGESEEVRGERIAVDDTEGKTLSSQLSALSTSNRSQLSALSSPEKDIHFLIIGEGKKKAELMKEVEEKKLTNVTFLPFQDFSVLPYSLASADLGVITLDENVAKVSVPSKTFNLLAVGAPLLAIASKETEMYRLINKYQNGRCIPKSRIQEIADYILELKNNKELQDKYRQNSLAASKDFIYKNAELYLE